MTCCLSDSTPIEAINTHNAPSLTAASRRRERYKIAVIHSARSPYAKFLRFLTHIWKEQPL